MAAQLVILVVGFVLTTVLGGALGSYFQRRAWSHQHDVQVAEQERARAVQIFEEVSRLLDKRLYRMRLFHWSLSSLPVDRAVVEERLTLYRQVLMEWNDNINRNLALLQQYFGDDFRVRLDSSVGADFVALGRELEHCYRHLRNTDEHLYDSATVELRIVELNSLIYGFNLDMIRVVQAGTIGELVPGRRSATAR